MSRSLKQVKQDQSSASNVKVECRSVRIEEKDSLKTVKVTAHTRSEPEVLPQKCK